MKISLELIVLKFLLKKGLEKEFSREEDLRRFFYWEVAVRFNFENPPFPFLRVVEKFH